MSDWIKSGAYAPCSHDDERYRRRSDAMDRRTRGVIPLHGMAVILSLLSMLVFNPVAARDNGQFAGSSPELKAWFDSLRSGKGPCCSDADGSAVSDVDWVSNAGHYRVRLDGNWLDVPDEAVITTPNKVGRTMVWPIRLESGVLIRCFMPGSMT